MPTATTSPLRKKDTSDAPRASSRATDDVRGAEPPEPRLERPEAELDGYDNLACTD